MKKTITIFLFLLLNQLSFCELMQDTTHHFKLIKLTEDAITDDSYKPIAGKEKLLAVKVVDESGKGVFGAEVKFEIVAGDGELIGSTTNQVSKHTIIETSAFNGTIGIIMTVDSKPQIINKVKATLLSDETQNVEFAFQTIELPKQLENRNLLQEAWQNDQILHQNCIEEWETESDAKWTVGPTWQREGDKNIQKYKRWQKNNSVKTQITFPTNKISGKKGKGILKPVEAPELDKIAYNSYRNECVLIYRNQSKKKLSDYVLFYTDCNKLVIVKEERIKIKGSTIFNRYTEEYFDWQRYPKAKNVWGYIHHIQKSFNGYDILTDTTIRKFIRREISNKISNKEFEKLEVK